MDSAESLILLSPQLLLLAWALVVFGLDLAFKKSRDVVAYVALSGFAPALVAAVYLLGQGTNQSILSGMVRVDAFSLYFAVIACLAAGLVILASMEYMKARTRYRGEFYALLLLATLAMSLMSSSTNLIMIYLSIEFMSLTSYVLVGFFRDDPKSAEGGLKYFLFGAVTSALMLYGMSLMYGATGTTDLQGIASSLAGMQATMPPTRWLILPSILLMIAGFSFKMALVPFHQWSPDAYEGAPTPVATLLSVGPKAMAFAILLRVLLTAVPAFQFDWVAILMGISLVTMTLGNLTAIRQTNIKRMLAYSSIAQAGYILVGVVSIVPFTIGIHGVLFYLMAYLFTNAGVFIAVIAFSHVTNSDEISDYAGLVRRAPALAAVMVIFFMSLAGLPPTAGFVGKLLVFGAAVQAGYYYLAIIGVVNSVISVAYYFNVVRQMFFLPPPTEEPLSLPGFPMAAVMVCVVLVMAIGLYAQPLIDLVSRSVTVLAMIP
ncbi:MAG TPA: NADH-quinone oxidoreductase subunit N [Chloroflexi bacterium]|nr:NADH-quinone oxidoreductase subunit N [Chloroflexota bacterium]